MEVITIETEAYQALKREQIKMFKNALKEFCEENFAGNREEEDWLLPEQAKKIIPYTSKAKWKELRVSGKIKFTRFGRKIKYSKKSLLAFLHKNMITL